ncbi:AimR family lysis-lysogeny pheromone receptor [Aquibacillus albus]|uniref:Tetratricopeptide repeat protein n=1 Tax=Aquibacillus albus TaxID=1168171 RepID=A0ABS2MZL7_9BACI|nr:AimR family lysis-lysogeny pheromone receptor [Aquibacillus albus]MBM7571300.1 hypothetical protein [Aquibacillus albus]
MSKQRSIKRTFNKDYDESLHLHHYLAIVSKNNDEKTVIRLSKKFCLESKRESDWRVGMEFLYMNGCLQEVRQLITRNKQSHNCVNKTWGIVYDIMLQWKNRAKAAHLLLHELNEIKTNTPELACIVSFLKVSIHYSTYQFDCIGSYLDNIAKQLSKIENPLLASSFTIRYHELLFIYYWKRNELILARKYGFRAINQTYHLEKKAHLHIRLALSYIYEDFTSSIYHLNEAIKLAKVFDNQPLLSIITEHNYPFVCAHFGQADGVQTTDLSEQAHLEIAKGNLKKAKSILSKIPINSPFRKYYLGLATGDRELLIHAYYDFVERRSDHFFARMPLQAFKQP